jgi:hypothetical protein
MSWLDLIDRNEALKAVFGTTVPHLDSVRLHEVTLHQDGPTIVLRFDLSEFPKDAPMKWLKAGHNTVQVRLVLDDVCQTRIEGWTTNNVGNLSVGSNVPAGVRVEFLAGQATLFVVSRFARLDGVSGYCDSVRR